MDGIVRENSNGTTEVRQTDSDRFQEEVMETSDRKSTVSAAGILLQTLPKLLEKSGAGKITGKFTGNF
jgi:hypothetical protein